MPQVEEMWSKRNLAGIARARGRVVRDLTPVQPVDKLLDRTPYNHFRRGIPL